LARIKPSAFEPFVDLYHPILCCFVFVCFCLFIYLLLFRAALVAYGGSQARSRIGAVAAGLSLICDPHHGRILNPSDGGQGSNACPLGY